MKMTDNERAGLTAVFQILADKFRTSTPVDAAEGSSTEGATISLDISITCPGCAPKKLFSSRITKAVRP